MDDVINDGKVLFILLIDVIVELTVVVKFDTLVSIANAY